MQISFMLQICGRTALDHRGWTLGKIEDVLIDSRSLRIEALRVRLTSEAVRELRLEARDFLDLPAELFDLAGDAVLVNASTSDLRDLAVVEQAADAAEAPGSARG
jgi:sporulation protein YlmC with PRC-barrel domain